MLHQSPYADGRYTAPIPYAAGMLAAVAFTWSPTKDYTAATDLIEMGALPANAKLFSATLLSDGFAAGLTADVAVMDGEEGKADDSRDLTAVTLLAGAAVDGSEVPVPTKTCLNIKPDISQHRGLGVRLSRNESASAAKKLTLVIQYTY